MTPLVTNVTTILSLLTVVADIIIALSIIGLLLFWAGDASTKKLIRKISKHSLGIAFIFSLGAPIGSLFYSQIAGFAPCELCWLQRICAYPSVIILALALWFTRSRKESHIKNLPKIQRELIEENKIALRYFTFTVVLILSILGAGIAAYHSYGQLVLPDILPACDAVGVSCAKLYFVDFGYVAIPTMSLTSFLLIIMTAVYYFVDKKPE